MIESEKPELGEFIIGFCSRAGIDPEADIFGNSDLVKEGFSLTIGKLLQIVIRQNFGPVLSFLREDTESKRAEFKMFRDVFKVDIESIPSKVLSDYLKEARLLFRYGLFYTDIITTSELYLNITDFAYSDAPFFYIGGPGMGKKTIARMSYDLSPRNNNEFASLDCSELSEEELFSLLSGVDAPDDTGAKTKHQGLIEKTSERTLFLYGLEDVSPRFKKTFLKLANKELYFRSADSEMRRADLRLICAINYKPNVQYPADYNYEDSRDSQIKFEIGERFTGKFRDLVELKHIPQNIPLIIYLYSEKVKKQKNFTQNIKFPHILIHYWLNAQRWPDNYRQLGNTIEDYVGKYIEFVEIKPSVLGATDKKSIEKEPELYSALLDLTPDKEFKSYIGLSQLRPFDILDHCTVATTPFIIFRTRYYDSRKNKWDFNTNPKIIGDVNYFYRRQITHLQLEEQSEQISRRDFEQISFPPPNGKLVWPGKGKPLLRLIPESDIGKPIPSSFKKEEKANKDQEIPRYPITDFNKIKAEIDNDGYAVTRIELIPKGDSEIPPLIIGPFVNTNTQEFTFLLFLIYERKDQDKDWLYRILRYEDKLKFDRFKIISKCCGLSNKQIEHKGWWNDSNRISWVAKSINEKAGKSGLNGELVERYELIQFSQFQPPRKKSGKQKRSYRINSSLPKAAIKNLNKIKI